MPFVPWMLRSSPCHPILLLPEVLQLALQNLRSGTTQVSAHPLTEFVFGTLPPETGAFFRIFLEQVFWQAETTDCKKFAG